MKILLTFTYLQQLKRKFMLEDEMGRKMSAMDVFSASIKYLKDHLMNRCQQQLPDATDTDIRWVLTVPAIWNDTSKQFMREAAQLVISCLIIIFTSYEERDNLKQEHKKR
jgi:hypothetical protein